MQATQVHEHRHFPQADVAERGTLIERQGIERRGFPHGELTATGRTAQPPDPGVRVQKEGRVHDP